MKKRGSTASKGVYLHKYSNMNNVDTSNSVIQEDLNNPYLYENRRFKIRAYILIFQNNIYINRKAWCSLGALDYKKADDTTTAEDIEKINIIYQSPGRKWFNFKEIPDYEDIFSNMCNSCNDIYEKFQDKISNYKDTEYSILGVDENASSDDIKKAYRKLSMKHHPDRGGKKDLFQKINTAYQAIGDHQKRQQYNMSRNGNPLANLFGGMRGPQNSQDGLGQMFNMMFGGGFPGGMNNPNVHFFQNGVRMNQNVLQKPPPIVKTIEISSNLFEKKCE